MPGIADQHPSRTCGLAEVPAGDSALTATTCRVAPAPSADSTPRDAGGQQSTRQFTVLRVSASWASSAVSFAFTCRESCLGHSLHVR